MKDTPGRLALRLITAAGLAIDAYVHLDLATRYGTTGGAVSEGLLFRVEAGAAIVVALLVLVSGRRVLHIPALVVAISALGAVVLYRYVDVGPLGPLPDMYDPAWFPEKVLSTVAVAVATVGSAVLVCTGRPASRSNSA